MANTVPPFEVDDTSPTIQYFPFSDTLSTPNFTAGWNPLFNQTSIGGAPIEVENSTTVHVTSLNNASFSLQWQGTGIQLVGYATQASYSILVDGRSQVPNPNSADGLLASIQNLENTNHEISLTTIIPNISLNQTQSFVVFDKAVISAPPTSDNNTSSTFTSQSLNDSDINFRGKWSFQDNSAPIRLSNNANDSAMAQFNGTAFQIFGTVSPQGGNYTVQLDNSTTQFSARASFAQNNTLLFFASALDPNVAHTVQIVNDGGTLILPVGSFRAVSSGNPNLAPPTGTSSAAPSATASGTSAGNLSSGGLSKGTVAALALAGVLAFILISCLLFCVFIWRPRKRRQRQAQRERRMIERQGSGGDAVLDIGPHSASYMSRSPGSRWSRRTRDSPKGSGRSGFLRWKQDLEAANGGKVLGALGLVFRHSVSDSPKGKQPTLDDLDLYEDEAGSRKSSSLSSGGSPQRKKGKGKSRWNGRSQKYTPSPRYTIDLPPLSRSREQLEEEAVPEQPPAESISPLTSLTYMSTPNTENSRELSFNAPSDASDASPNHGRTDSSGMLLVHGGYDGRPRSEDVSVVEYPSSVVSTHQETDPGVDVHEFEVQSAYTPSSRSRAGAASLYARELDRGSVRTNDDGLSMLGPATARAAIRSLSPRTSELVFPPSLEQLVIAGVPAQAQTSVPRERLLSDDTVRPSEQPRARSPYRLDTGKRSSFSASRKSTGLSVRFEDDDEDSEDSEDKGEMKGKGKGKGKEVVRESMLAVPTRTAFRLTPPRPITSPISERDSTLTTSFLDFSSSNSNSNSDSSHRDPSVASQTMGLKSRWSATTAATGTDPDSHNIRQEPPSESPSPSSNFPFPVSLPASPHHPEGFKPSPPITPSWEAGTLAVPPGQLNVNPPPHPFRVASNPASPSDSVPMSVSDLQFRHSSDSDSENGVLGMTTNPHLPPHPPLPSVPPTPTFPPPRISVVSPSSPTEPLSSPSYIVSRVFPHTRSGSGSDPQSPPAHRTFGSS